MVKYTNSNSEVNLNNVPEIFMLLGMNYEKQAYLANTALT